MPHPFSEYRERVSEDAIELAAVIEIAEPLTQNTMESLKPGDHWEVAIILRRVLPRSSILTALRLIENTPPGRSGTTAGILALANSAVSEKALTEKQRDEIITALDRLLTAMEADGLRLEDLRLFRNAYLAHTLIPHNKLSNDIWAHLVFKHFRYIVSLVANIEKMLDANGVKPKSTFMHEIANWGEKSASFWSCAEN